MNRDINSLLGIITVIIISISFIYISGIFIYKHDNASIEQKNPLYFALGITFSSAGAGILFKLILDIILPKNINDQLKNIKNN